MNCEHDMHVDVQLLTYPENRNAGKLVLRGNCRQCGASLAVPNTVSVAVSKDLREVHLEIQIVPSPLTLVPAP